MNWFRMYAEVVHDPKVQCLPPQVFKHWVNLLCVCCGQNGALPSIDNVAYHLRIDVDKAKILIDKLFSVGLIDEENGVLRPHNWGSRQFVSDSSTRRVIEHRKRFTATGETFQERSSNAPRTDTEQIQNRTEFIDCAIAQSPSTPVEENGDPAMKLSLANPPFSTLGGVRKKKPKQPTDAEIVLWFETEFWPLYPRRICKVSAMAAAHKRAISSEIRAEIISGLDAQLPQLSARESEFIPYPSTWLNQERWKDEPEKPRTHVSKQATQHEEVLGHFRRMMRKEATRRENHGA